MKDGTLTTIPALGKFALYAIAKRVGVRRMQFGTKMENPFVKIATNPSPHRTSHDQDNHKGRA
jgi:hypothetical protein